MQQRGCLLIISILWLSVGNEVVAAEPIDFVRDVRPIFEKHCYVCHGPDKHKGGLRLDVKGAVFAGGDVFGAALIRGKPAESPLIQFVSQPDADLKMPPEGAGLAADEVAVLVRWVEEGAVWPDGVDKVQLVDRRDHWSLKPRTNPTPPTVRDASWPRSPLDQFVLARLEAAQLAPAPETERVSWLRRVTFDLTGLPPAPERVAAFVQDQRPDAYEHVVEELLASPQYGERWAQHWLDVVRYADTHGFEVNTERPHAWPYRDYVIEAFNQDTPYDRFILEQIVGDTLGKEPATGFLITASVLLPGQIGADEPSKRLARQDSLDEIVVNIGQTFLGFSVGCARCHDHKFDAISQKDYYAMQAFVAGVEYADRPLPVAPSETREQAIQQQRLALGKLVQQLDQQSLLVNSGTPRPMVTAKRNVDRFAPQTAQRLRFTILKTNNLEPCLDELEIFTTDGVNVALAGTGAKVSSSGDNISPERHELRFLNDGKYGNSRSWMSNEMGQGWAMIEFPQAHTIERVVWGRDREGTYSDRLALQYRIEIADVEGEWRTVAEATDRIEYKPDQPAAEAFPVAGLSDEAAAEVQRLLAEKGRVDQQLAELTRIPLAFAGQFRQPDVIRQLRRGDPEQPMDVVLPAVLSAFGGQSLAADVPEAQRRRALADWIIQPDHPLTARVMANRIWQWHFGTGLVETANDFGRNGTLPTHPELLDWLANEFVRGGWSVKQMHRLIVLSATYRQSTRFVPEFAAQDADVRLLWRYPSRRLEGEAIRDSIVQISGRLNAGRGGPGFNLFNQRGGLSGFNPVESFSGDGLRRMIYAHKVRRERDSVFGAFDCPDAGQSQAKRRESTTPIQALNLLNSRFVIEQSQACAALIQQSAGEDLSAQIRLAYQKVLSREPSAEELAEVEPVVQAHGLATLCRALFNSNEFLFIP